MSKKQCAYDILGATKDMDTKQIKKLYRKLAMQYHPDKNPGDQDSADMMNTINEAWAVLEDDDLRKKYDRGGWDALDDNGNSSSGPSHQTTSEKADSFFGKGGAENPNEGVMKGKRRTAGRKRTRPKW